MEALLEEILKALEHAALGLKVHRSKGRWLTPEPSPELNPILRINVEDQTYELNIKHIAALLSLHRSGGVLPLSSITEACGVTQRQALGLVLGMKEMGLVDLAGTATRKAVMLTPLGRRVAEKIEERLKGLGTGLF